MAAGPARPCLDCGRLTRAGSRCEGCRRTTVRRRSWAQGSATAQGYGYAWRQVTRRVLDRDGHVCRYCGGSADTVDHVVPKARGGSDDESNLVAACRPCNSAKRDR